MLELKAIQRKRKLFYRIMKYSLIVSPLILLMINFINPRNHAFMFYTIEKVFLGIFVITLIYFAFTNWFPVFTEFKNRGNIVFDDQCITKSVFGKERKFNLNELNEVKFEINGYWGQDISLFPHIKIADGTNNYVIIKTKDFKIEKTEFYLANKQNLNSLSKYIKCYQDQIEVTSS